MIDIFIPGHEDLHLDHLVLDYNGTLAVDGSLINGVKAALDRLKDSIHIHVLTADTFGKAASKLEGTDCTLSILPPGRQDVGKREYVKNIDSGATVAVGNGCNDCLMLDEAALGIAVIQKRAPHSKRSGRRMWFAPTSYRRWNSCTIRCGWWPP